jgi:hypothetical protein
MSVERDFLNGDRGPTFCGKITLPPEQQELRRELERLEREMFERKRMNYTAEEIQRYRYERIYAISEKYYISARGVADELRQRLDRARADYLRRRKESLAEDMLNLQRWKNEYASMDKDDLAAEFDSYLDAPSTAWDPDRLAVLSAELGKHGVKEVGHSPKDPGGQVDGTVQTKPVGEWIELKHGLEPWVLEHPGIVAGLRLYDSGFGCFSTLTEDGDVTEQFEIKKAYADGKD